MPVTVRLGWQGDGVNMPVTVGLGWQGGGGVSICQ